MGEDEEEDVELSEVEFVDYGGLSFPVKKINRLE